MLEPSVAPLKSPLAAMLVAKAPAAQSAGSAASAVAVSALPNRFPVTSPVTLPVRSPAKVAAVMLPLNILESAFLRGTLELRALSLTLEFLVAAWVPVFLPPRLPVKPVAVPLTFPVTLPVTSPVRLPVTFPLILPVKFPLKPAAEIVPLNTWARASSLATLVDKRSSAKVPLDKLEAFRLTKPLPSLEHPKLPCLSIELAKAPLSQPVG